MERAKGTQRNLLDSDALLKIELHEKPLNDATHSLRPSATALHTVEDEVARYTTYTALRSALGVVGGAEEWLLYARCFRGRIQWSRSCAPCVRSRCL